MTDFTIFGARGFIGSALALHLRAAGHEVVEVARDFANLPSGDLGHVIYAIGLTGDFRERPFDAVEAHVGLLSRLLPAVSFRSWLYLSSTRVYAGLAEGARATEEAALPVRPSADTTYDLGKLLGEALCLAHPSRTVRAVRLANVYGPGQSTATFLGSILAAIRGGTGVTIREAPASAKDYVALADVVPLLERIALEGRYRLYNVATGAPVSHATLAEAIGVISALDVSFLPHAPLRRFPTIDVTRLRQEFGVPPARLLSDLPALLAQPSTHPALS